jgi:predicted transcriptional regulator
MPTHRGKVLEELIRNKGYSLSQVARHLDISRRTLYNYFEDPQLSWQKLSHIDQILQLNLGSRLTEMRNYYTHHKPTVLNEHLDAEYWRAKYIALLEKYTSLLEDK